MIGKKFGCWSVLNQIDYIKPGIYYECICKCGDIRIKKGTELRAGRGLMCRACQYAKLYNPSKMIGKRFSKWTVIRFVDIHRKLMRFESECDCGNKGIHAGADLRAGKTKQCVNCHNKENAINNRTHGMHQTRIYKVWTAMVDRCSNPNSTNYYRYGGRGIKVCDNWLKFENFLKDMGVPEKGLTIDRINNDGNYEKSNCRWVTHKVNCQNRSSTKKGPC